MQQDNSELRERARKIIEQARKLRQAAKFACWEAVTLREAVQETYLVTKEIRQQIEELAQYKTSHEASQ